MVPPPAPLPTRPLTFTTPSGQTIQILQTDVSGGRFPFDEWPDADQNRYLDLIQGHLADVHTDGSLEHLCHLSGLSSSKFAGSSPEEVASSKEQVIDGVSWKITQALRKTRPTRIAEAVDHIKFVIKRQKRMNNGRLIEALPPWYLGVAYSHIPGKEDEAIEAFIEGFKVFEATRPTNIHLNELWARSHFAQMLRRKGRIEEAMEQERLTRQWIIRSLTYCAPSTFRKNIEGPGGRGEHITDHGEVLEEFSQIEEIDPSTAVWHRGGQEILLNYGRKS